MADPAEFHQSLDYELQKKENPEEIAEIILSSLNGASDKENKMIELIIINPFLIPYLEPVHKNVRRDYPADVNGKFDNAVARTKALGYSGYWTG
ncbi:hypothetical protein HYX17_00980 [Candidatus Woesearchaeota archaeon]|nr:hypothetical protein [Candidatus Woesearchaeota archaeon]